MFKYIKGILDDIKSFNELRESRKESKKLSNSDLFHKTYNELVNKVLLEAKQNIENVNELRFSDFVKNNPPMYKQGDEVMINKWYNDFNLNTSEDLLSTFINIKCNSKFIVKSSKICVCDPNYNINDILNKLIYFKEDIQEVIHKNKTTDVLEMEEIIYSNIKKIAESEISHPIYKKDFYNSIELDFDKSGVMDKHGSPLYVTWNDFDEKSFIDCRDIELVECVNLYVNTTEEIKRQNIVLENVKEELRGRLNNSEEESNNFVY